jgi:hypothetical protein
VLKHPAQIDNMLLVETLKNNGFDFSSLPADVKQAVNVVLESPVSPQVEVLDEVVFKIAKEKRPADPAVLKAENQFMNEPGNDGFNTMVPEKVTYEFEKGGEVSDWGYVWSGDIVTKGERFGIQSPYEMIANDALSYITTLIEDFGDLKGLSEIDGKNWSSWNEVAEDVIKRNLRLNRSERENWDYTEDKYTDNNRVSLDVSLIAKKIISNVDFDNAVKLLTKNPSNNPNNIKKIIKNSLRKPLTTKLIDVIKVYRGIGTEKNKTYGGTDDGMGKFYTDNVTMAEWFAGISAYDEQTEKYHRTGQKGYVEQATISFKKPYVIDKSYPGYDISDGIDSFHIYMNQISEAGSVDKFKNDLVALDYDGIILKDNATNYYSDGLYNIYIKF